MQTAFILLGVVLTLWDSWKMSRAMEKAAGGNMAGYLFLNLLLFAALGVLGLLLAGAGWVVWALFGLGETAKAYLVGLPGALGIMVLMFLVPIFSLVFVVVLFVGDR